MPDQPFQPGTWIQLPSNCTRSLSLTYQRCAEWGVLLITECLVRIVTYEEQCVSWAWQQVKKCAWWSWLVCVLFAIVLTLVCAVVALVAIFVCVLVGVIELIVCLLWTLISVFFCLSQANGGTMFLLGDGTVMAQEFVGLNLYFLGIPRFAFGTRRWWKLTPDVFGSYAQGSWSRLADSRVARTAFASAVLADGRVVVCGGENSDASGTMKLDYINTCEIYDPVANRWSPFAQPVSPGTSPKVWEFIGDSPGALLPDGRFLLGSLSSRNVAVLDPATLTWTALKDRPEVISSDEDTWVLMPDDTIAAPSCMNIPETWVYRIATDSWIKGPPLPQTIVDPADNDVGPGLLRYDGTALFIGATEHTAIYSPAATPQWFNGPDLPDQTVSGNLVKIGVHDGPAALLVNGNMLFCAGVNVGLAESSPCWYFEFDGAVFNRTSDPPNNVTFTYSTTLLLLPNGDVMVTANDDSSFYAYHSEAAVPQESFRPVIQTCPATIVLGTTIEVSGLQFNGLSQATGYGDDSQTATNYPLVRIVNRKSNRVRYCRTFNHTRLDAGGNVIPSMGVATGATVVTTHVEIPTNLEPGESDLFVVANGIRRSRSP